jgi:hypothetical protein
MRRSISSGTEAEVLHLSRRRCCLCFGLFNKLDIKRGQIAHLDHDPANNAIENLAFLCLEHHDEYDTTTSQSKGIKLKEVLIHRESLYAAVRQYLDPREHSGSVQVSAEEPPLASTGELEYYLATSNSLQSAGLLVLARIRAGNKALVDDLSTANAAAMEEVRRGLASLSGRRRYHSKLGAAFSSFARTLTREAEELAVTTARMLDTLSRAAAVASDIEIAEPAMFEQKIQELHSFREALSATGEGATKTRGMVLSLPRGTTEFNKGRRLAIAAFEMFAETVQRELTEIDRYEAHLLTAKELL